MKFAFFFLFIFIRGVCSAGESTDSSQKIPGNHSITYVEYILTDFKASISHISEGRFYLKPEMIYCEGEQLYLCNGQSQLALPFVYYDGSGYYVSAELVNPLVPFYKCTNPMCGQVWDAINHPRATCPICNSPGKLIGI